MADFVLGQAPHRVTVVLASGSDFVATLTRSDNAAWPEGTSVELVIDNHPAWPATVDGASVNWEVDEAVVGPVIAAGPKRAKLYHTLGTARMMWATGPVVVR